MRGAFRDVAFSGYVWLPPRSGFGENSGLEPDFEMSRESSESTGGKHA